MRRFQKKYIVWGVLGIAALIANIMFIFNIISDWRYALLFSSIPLSLGALALLWYFINESRKMPTIANLLFLWITVIALFIFGFLLFVIVFFGALNLRQLVWPMISFVLFLSWYISCWIIMK